jgi:hypothetical protein
MLWACKRECAFSLLKQKVLTYLMMAKYPGRIERSYECFLELPVPVVLVLLWLAGVPLAGVVPLSLCAAALYSY